jgi:hypothetical protein
MAIEINNTSFVSVIEDENFVSSFRWRNVNSGWEVAAGDKVGTPSGTDFTFEENQGANGDYGINDNGINPYPPLNGFELPEYNAVVVLTKGTGSSFNNGEVNQVNDGSERFFTKAYYGLSLEEFTIEGLTTVSGSSAEGNAVDIYLGNVGFTEGSLIPEQTFYTREEYREANLSQSVLDLVGFNYFGSGVNSISSALFDDQFFFNQYGEELGLNSVDEAWDFFVTMVSDPGSIGLDLDTVDSYNGLVGFDAQQLMIDNPEVATLVENVQVASATQWFIVSHTLSPDELTGTTTGVWAYDDLFNEVPGLTDAIENETDFGFGPLTSPYWWATINGVKGGQDYNEDLMIDLYEGERSGFDAANPKEWFLNTGRFESEPTIINFGEVNTTIS